MKNNGFTLIELLIAICITSIVAGTIATIFINSIQNASDMQKKIVMQQNGRSALNFIANEIMMAGYSPASGGNGITSAGLNDIEFTKDYNNDGLFTGQNETIRFNFDNTTNNQLIMSFSNGDDKSTITPVLDDVEGFRLLYAYDIHGLGSEGYGQLETTGSNDIQWAFDSNDDKILDRYYTYTNSGFSEVPLTDNLRNNIGKPLPISRIRAVKIMLLVRSNTNRSYSMENRTSLDLPGMDSREDAGGLNSGFSYKMLSTNVKLRNMYF